MLKSGRSWVYFARWQAAKDPGFVIADGSRYTQPDGRDRLPISFRCVSRTTFSPLPKRPDYYFWTQEKRTRETL